jgi:hypothetical protein
MVGGMGHDGEPSILEGSFEAERMRLRLLQPVETGSGSYSKSGRKESGGWRRVGRVDRDDTLSAAKAEIESKRLRCVSVELAALSMIEVS